MKQAHDTTEVGHVRSQANHELTFLLPVGARCVYAILCTLLVPAETQLLSQEDIALVGNLSEATVSRWMPILAQEFALIEREPSIGGHLITLVALPPAASPGDLLDKARAWRTCQGSPNDPTPEPLGSAGDPTFIHHSNAGSPADPALCMDDSIYDSCSNTTTTRAHEEQAVLHTATPTPAEVWQQLQKIRSDYTLSDLHTDFQKLIERGKSPADATGILAWAVRNRQPIYSANECSERASAFAALLDYGTPTSTRPAEPPVRPQRPKYAHTPHAVIPNALPLSVEAEAERLARARRLGPNVTHDEFLALLEAIDEGLDDVGVLAFLVAEQEAGRV